MSEIQEGMVVDTETVRPEDFINKVGRHRICGNFVIAIDKGKTAEVHCPFCNRKLRSFKKSEEDSLEDVKFPYPVQY